MTAAFSCLPLPRRGVGALVLVAFVLLGAGHVGALTIADVRIGAVSTQGAIVRWSTEADADGRVIFGPGDADRRTVVEDGRTRDHYVFLGDLAPGVTYRYHVQSGGETSAEQSFTTAAKVEDLWPVVSLSFDDGHISHFTNAFPMLKARNMRGMVNVVSDRLAKPVGMSLDQVRFLQRQGWEIASHSRSHNRDKSLTDEEEVVGSFDYLTANGLKVTSYRLPGSNHSPAREALAAVRYPLRWGNVVGRPPSPRYGTLPLAPGMYAGLPLDFRKDATIEKRVARYRAAVDEMLERHLYLHLIFHAIQDTSPEGYHYTLAEFGALLDYLEAKGIKVIPPGELLQEISASDRPAGASLP